MKTFAVFDGTEVERLRRYAEEHPYRFPQDTFIPGTKPEYVAEVAVTVASTTMGVIKQKVRVVFTHLDDAEDSGQVFRIASFTLLEGDAPPVDVAVEAGLRLSNLGLPAPTAVQAICMGLGFRGAMGDWTVTAGDGSDPRVIMVQQPVEQGAAPRASA